MSETPPHHPDPTRDTTGDAAQPTGPVADSADLADRQDDGPVPDAPSAAEPADLPSDAPAPEELTAYDTTFGLEPPPISSWVPPKAGGETAEPAASPARLTPPPVGARLRTITVPGAAGRSLGGRLRAWHVVAIMVGVLVPVGAWAASGLADDFDPITRPALSVTRNRPMVTRSFPVPSSSTAVRGANPSPSAPGASTRPTTPTRSVLTSPPTLVPVPALPVTPVPASARTIRFEAYAENGGRIDVSLSDARHQRYDYPAQASPLAFEVPVDPAATSNDYYSLRVRTDDPTGSGVRGAVACRVLVDGIVVITQQGQGYATCYISPYFDIRRR